MRASSVCLTAIVLFAATSSFSEVANTSPAASNATQASAPEPTGPTAVIDTTLGRLRCKLFSAERPAVTANFIALAEDATDPANRNAGHPKPYWDGTRLDGIPAGIRSADRFNTADKPTLPLEPAPTLHFDRPGRLAMIAQKGMTSATQFVILDHANSEAENPAAQIFGQCDDASVKIVAAISHRLKAVDNEPASPIAINHIAILRDGQPAPPLTPNLPVASIAPPLRPNPKSAIPAPEPTGPTALIETSLGTLSCKLFSKESPIATATFIGLANGTKPWKNPVTQQMETNKRFYDGIAIDRVIPDFVIQSGDFTNDISGSVDIGFRFKNESTPGLLFDRPGRLAFGNDGPDRNNSEIFITEHPIQRLDGGFTIFGQCDPASVALVQAIARVPRGADNKPITPVVIQRIMIQAQ
jgi:cyclophilin family peptidyl-prolyl cis-trans isomerase